MDGSLDCYERYGPCHFPLHVKLTMGTRIVDGFLKDCRTALSPVRSMGKMVGPTPKVAVLQNRISLDFRQRDTDIFFRELHLRPVFKGIVSQIRLMAGQWVLSTMKNFDRLNDGRMTHHHSVQVQFILAEEQYVLAGIFKGWRIILRRGVQRLHGLVNFRKIVVD